MSLLDSMLLEAPQPALSASPQEVWLAIRTDGNKGSGTGDDPLDAGSKP